MKVSPAAEFVFWTGDQLKESAVKQLQGISSAQVVMLTPAVRQEEVKEERCWTGPSMEMFIDNILADAFAGVGASKLPEMILIPLTFFPVRPTITRTAMTKRIFEKAIEIKQFKLFVCLGGDVLKFLINRGAALSQEAQLSGLPYYPRDLKGKPMFAFPDPNVMYSLLKDKIRGPRMLEATKKVASKFALFCHRTLKIC